MASEKDYPKARRFVPLRAASCKSRIIEKQKHALPQSVCNHLRDFAAAVASGFRDDARSQSHAMAFSVPLGKDFLYSVAFEKGRVCVAIDTSVTRIGRFIELQPGAQSELWENHTSFISYGAEHSYFEQWTKDGGYTELITRYCVISTWVLLVITAIMPLIWLDWRASPRNAKANGALPVCGYDLRASSGRCPECGTLRGAR